MCGILGSVTRSPIAQDSFKKALMLQAHRGPDYIDTKYIKSNLNILLGHNRLAILDLTNAANQPISSSCGRYTMIFNGEIYNYIELRSHHLYSKNIRSSGDSEVLIELISLLGLARALELCNGMWAIALYDHKDNTLSLSRDRFGEKPLYYSYDNEELIFSSELKALLELSQRKHTLNPDTISCYVTQSLMDYNHETLLKDVHQVPQSKIMQFKLDKFPHYVETISFSNIILKENDYSIDEACEIYDEILRDSVRIRTRSDRKLGVLLSGGLDSSAICHHLNELGMHTEALSATSPGTAYDESKYARLVASHLGLKHSEVDLNRSAYDFIDYMKKATFHNDAPIGSFSNIAHMWLMEEAKKLGITVILSGQGADESLLGYRKYLGFHIQDLNRSKSFLKASKTLSDFAINGTLFSNFNLNEARRYLPGKKVKTNIFGDYIKAPHLESIGLQKGQNLKDRQISDLKKYSVPYLNHYEDRMSMSMSREIRLPFLDHRLVDFTLSLKDNYKLRNGWTKYVLRKSIDKKLPNEIVWRKDKKGFSNPQEKWMKEELKDFFRDYISSDNPIYNTGLISKGGLEEKYEDFLSGKAWYREVFNAISLDYWLREYKIA